MERRVIIIEANELRESECVCERERRDKIIK